MAARRRKKDDDFIGASFGALVIGAIGYLVFLFKSNRERFYEIVVWIVVAFLALVVLFLIVKRIAKKIRTKRHDEIDRIIVQNNLSGQITNYIEREGKARGKKGTVTKIGSYTFENSSLVGFRKELSVRGLELKDWELENLLAEIIDKLDQKRIAGVMDAATGGNLMDLDPARLEELVGRLYEAMGYQTQVIGGSHDQGADVLANSPAERLAIQVKQYNQPVGNSAVQQAHTAIGHYSCTSAVVVTTSEFTAGAIELAKSNGVRLIAGKELRDLLAKYLGQSWL